MTYLVNDPLISDRTRLLLRLLILITSIYCVLIDVISWELLSPVLLFIHSKEGLLCAGMAPKFSHLILTIPL